MWEAKRAEMEGKSGWTGVRIWKRLPAELLSCTLLPQGNEYLADCIDCPAGYFKDLTGVDDSRDCIECRVGTYVELTGSDMYTDCIECAVGKYNEATGSNNQTACIDCPAGKYVPATGSDEAADCIVSSQRHSQPRLPVAAIVLS